jgi:hypothetical protein
VGYYRGDYYRGDVYGFRGDYYRGDPGLFSFIGKALGGVAKVAGGFLSGGPMGAIKAGLGVIGGGGASTGVAMMPSPYPAMFGPTLPGGPQRGLINIGGGGSQTGLINIDGGGPGVPARVRGMHVNKSTYETRGGGTSRWGGPGNLQLHPKGTTLVRNRRMQVGNTRALKRSLRRIKGFAHLARSVMSFVHPKAGKGHFKFGKRKRR